MSRMPTDDDGPVPVGPVDPPVAPASRPTPTPDAEPTVRWGDGGVVYLRDRDLLAIPAYNAGPAPVGVGDHTATADFVPADGDVAVQLNLMSFTEDGEPAPRKTWFGFGMANASEHLPAGEYEVRAWLPEELGGGEVSGTLSI